MLSTTRGLNIDRGLKSINSLDKSRGLNNINKIKKDSDIYDDDFENKLVNEIDEIVKFSRDTEELLGKVYNKYSDLYYNNINTFYDRMRDRKLQNEGRLSREDIENELRDRIFRQKHYIDRPARIQYKNKINLKSKNFK